MTLPVQMLTPDLRLVPSVGEQPVIDGLNADDWPNLRWIRQRDNNRVIGAVGERDNELSVWIDESHRGRGRATQAVGLWLENLFEPNPDLAFRDVDSPAARGLFRHFYFDRDGGYWHPTAQTAARIAELVESQNRRYRMRVHMTLLELGIPPDYGQVTRLPLQLETRRLAFAGDDIYGRPQFLNPPALKAYQDMSDAAREDGVELAIVSAFRGFGYQVGILRRKLGAGSSISDIMAVSAAPGYSEHHSGGAVDLAATDGTPVLTEQFEQSQSFEWLEGRAAEFGFRMSYPRDNETGVMYEPWHWGWNGSAS